ncbi:Maf-like protein [Candidatus Protochlamydia naegleriophila]|uniref:dTTP/UTP pyrophosphatase n=1 Tax=Candidatus Protochlamydia naegleriophila TaxID=389348 RepID=A0A0U5K390_9BACT|nr:Maf family nucleotide pyrophosphatase [Candidatus Protochlamydia naegleriophila]CUI16571.1 Maf-like protein [Candidatus Protochlamydia naegleriophila]
MKLILGSQSPRRREILNFFSLPFEQVSPSFDEDSVPFDGDPRLYVTILSAGKANSLKSRFPQEIIVTADTIVYKDGKIFGKPRNKEEAFQNLRELAGHWHTVFTGITLCYQDKEIHVVQDTHVLFNSLSDQQIHYYQDSLHCADKAGGYMIQGAGSLIVNRIEGCYYNVMGLPVNALRQALQEAGIDLWQHLKDLPKGHLCE